MSEKPQAVVDQDFEDRWARWQARGAENDRVNRRKLFIIGTIFILSMATLGGLWFR